jgi:hypothetical protein
VADPPDDVVVAARLEWEAQRLIDDGDASTELKMAIDQLRADRTNGEALGEATERLRKAIDRGRDLGQGGSE